MDDVVTSDASTLARLMELVELRRMFVKLQEEGVIGRQTAIASGKNPDEPRLVRLPLFFGGYMLGDLREVVAQQIYLTGSFEEGLSRYLFLALQEGMTFFDVGAHFGYFSMLASARVGKSGKIVAFEPTKRTFSLLEKNANQRPNMKCENRAVSNESSVLTLNDYGPQLSAFNSIGGMRTFEKYAKQPVGTFTVETVQLDQYCESEGVVPDIVKIDAESCELSILHGMERLLTQSRPVVTVEVGDFDQLDDSVVASSAVLSHIQQRDYVLFEPTTNGLVRHELSAQRYDYDNMICIPSEHVDALQPSLLSNAPK